MKPRGNPRRMVVIPLDTIHTQFHLLYLILITALSLLNSTTLEISIAIWH